MTTKLFKKLEEEFNYYIENQQRFVEQYNGKFIVIKGQNVLGVYNSELEALKETTKHHKLGTFLLKKVEAGEESYTRFFHSRVIFA